MLELSLSLFDLGFGCFRNSPLLTQVGLFAVLGMLAGALMIPGLGLLFLGRMLLDWRWSRPLGAALGLAGLIVWVGTNAFAWYLTDRYPYRAADIYCEDQASSSAGFAFLGMFRHLSSSG